MRVHVQCTHVQVYVFLCQCAYVVLHAFPSPSLCRCILAVVLYFAIGMPIMYYVKGARGLEMIPLIGFWKDFPFLVKVGRERVKWWWVVGGAVKDRWDCVRVG